MKFGSRFLLHLRPLGSSTMMSTLSTPTVHCQLEYETVRERTGYPPSYAEAKNMKSLTLHTHGCPRASLRDCSSLLFFFLIGIISQTVLNSLEHLRVDERSLFD